MPDSLAEAIIITPEQCPEPGESQDKENLHTVLSAEPSINEPQNIPIDHIEAVSEKSSKEAIVLASSLKIEDKEIDTEDNLVVAKGSNETKQNHSNEETFEIIQTDTLDIQHPAEEQNLSNRSQTLCILTEIINDFFGPVNVDQSSISMSCENLTTDEVDNSQCFVNQHDNDGHEEEDGINPSLRYSVQSNEAIYILNPKLLQTSNTKEDHLPSNTPSTSSYESTSGHSFCYQKTSDHSQNKIVKGGNSTSGIAKQYLRVCLERIDLSSTKRKIVHCENKKPPERSRSVSNDKSGSPSTVHAVNVHEGKNKIQSITKMNHSYSLRACSQRRILRVLKDRATSDKEDAKLKNDSRIKKPVSQSWNNQGSKVQTKTNKSLAKTIKKPRAQIANTTPCDVKIRKLNNKRYLRKLMREHLVRNVIFPSECYDSLRGSNNLPKNYKVSSFCYKGNKFTNLKRLLCSNVNHGTRKSRNRQVVKYFRINFRQLLRVCSSCRKQIRNQFRLMSRKHSSKNSLKAITQKSAKMSKRQNLGVNSETPTPSARPSSSSQSYPPLPESIKKRRTNCHAVKKCSVKHRRKYLHDDCLKNYSSVNHHQKFKTSHTSLTQQSNKSYLLNPVSLPQDFHMDLSQRETSGNHLIDSVLKQSNNNDTTSAVSSAHNDEDWNMQGPSGLPGPSWQCKDTYQTREEQVDIDEPDSDSDLAIQEIKLDRGSN